MSVISVTNINDGDSVTAASVNNQVNTVVNDYNGNITDANIASGAAISAGKLAGGTSGMFAAYTSYTPTLTNLTLGTGTMVAKYSQIGKATRCEGRITIGNNAPSGVLTITLPVTSVTTYTSREPIGIGMAFDTSATAYYPLYAIWISSTTFKLVVITTVTGANPVFTDFGTVREVGITPVTFATGDVISWNLGFEAA